MTQYAPIGGGYSAAILNVGVALQSPSGADIYIQPGDDTSAMLDIIDALYEVSGDVDDAKRGAIADMVLGDYFAP